MKEQVEYFGVGSIKNLATIIKTEKSQKVFLVTGKQSYSSSGAAREVDKILGGYNFRRFSDFSPNPQEEEIKQGVEQAIAYSPDIIMGIGGGSPIDVSKSIKLALLEQEKRNLPLVAIPTTAGSGSEATYFIVSYQGKEKQSGGRKDITLPDYVILDPNFLMSLPKSVSASSGMDAFAQAVESYWSIYSTPVSKKLASKAITLTLANISAFVNHPSLDSAYLMARAANLAGKAINITKTTACHAIAYPLTSYFHIAHGHAVSLTLAEMLVYNSQVQESDCNDPRGVEYVRKVTQELSSLLGAKSPEEAKIKLNELMASIGLETKLSGLGIKEEQLTILLDNLSNTERLANNPRLLTRESLSQILKNIL